ncbi:MAG: hypothetical protein K9H61_06735 [Bacteroidia bacterium]|nr:hypothetical protein [Bacteroidia bacterium]MCF8428067.1 hypothetical protein [Bacteroidia bacterium]MCF8446674.1 hypothetical protein [Bacteroidia bacterium]
MNKITFLIPVISLFLFSCSETSKEKAKVETQKPTLEEQQHNTEIQAIELNNGSKWKVDGNMITHIRNMENDIIFFAKVEPKDYKILSKKLHSNIELLTSNCTMKGKAHDELHKWLLPFIEIVKVLSVAQNETESSKQFENIQISFKTFNQYFQ